MMKNYLRQFEILGVKYDSSMEEIKKAYKCKCLLYHPDKPNGDATKFQELHDAYNDIIKLKEGIVNFLYVFIWYCNNMIKANNIIIHCKVTIEELYTNAIKKISYNYIDSSLCSQTRIVFLELTGWQTEYYLENYGDYDVIKRTYLDLIIYIEIVQDTLTNVQINDIISKYELYTQVNINIFEYYFGVNKIIPYLNDEKITINYNPYENGDTLIVENKGLCNENGERERLYIFLKVDLSKCKKNMSTYYNVINEIFNK